MDYPLGVFHNFVKTNNMKVLIPILMDYPLGAAKHTYLVKRAWASLNPYSNGLPSRGTTKTLLLNCGGVS